MKKLVGGTGLMGATEPNQKVTAENIGTLPEGSVVRNKDGSIIVHLHDNLWLFSKDCMWLYDRIENMPSKIRKGAVLCHYGKRGKK